MQSALGRPALSFEKLLSKARTKESTEDVGASWRVYCCAVSAAASALEASMATH